jgi:hypothetical protein
MKKLMLSLMCAGLLQANLFASEEENNFKKSQAFTQDGVRFDRLEEEFRAKYSHLNIPEITMVDDLVAQYGWSSAGYVWKNHELLVDKKTMGELPASSWQWLMLHETGHAQMPYVVPAIHGTVTATQLLTPYFWGMHKKVPYKNIVTKLGSKAIATLVISTFVNVNAFRTEERRADNFANKHADKDVLHGGKKWCEGYESLIAQAWNGSGASQSMSQKTFANLIDPIHPTVDSRIAKIQKALKNRFGVEA